MAAETYESELGDLFYLATEFVRGLRDLKNENKLKFYGLFKQAKDGPCTKRKPAMWDMKGCAKWEAWKSLGNMSKEAAMRNYIDELTRLNKNWECHLDDNSKIYIEEEERSKGVSGLSGVSVSTLYNPDLEEECLLKDENKTVFDWCKEGNIRQLKKLLENEKIDVNSQDEEGMTLLHWACDRGFQDIVDYLIKLQTDIDCQDNEGQSPLHYAVICEFESIVKTLLDAGANRELTDNEGNTAVALTTQSKLVDLLSTTTP